MEDHYPSEKFSDAVRTLAMGKRPLQERMADAFSYNLHHLIGHDALPDDVKERLAKYAARWSAVDNAGEQGTIKVWARDLSDDEATDIASWIVETAFELNRQFWMDEE